MCQHPRKCNVTESESRSFCESADDTMCSGKGKYRKLRRATSQPCSEGLKSTTVRYKLQHFLSKTPRCLTAVQNGFTIQHTLVRKFSILCGEALLSCTVYQQRGTPFGGIPVGVYLYGGHCLLGLHFGIVSGEPLGADLSMPAVQRKEIQHLTSVGKLILLHCPFHSCNYQHVLRLSLYRF